MNEKILEACMELIDDAKTSSADLVFKEICLEILSRARSVLTARQFKRLVAYASERMTDEIPVEFRHEFLVNR